jgi:hypothetical protein
VNGDLFYRLAVGELVADDENELRMKNAHTTEWKISQGGDETFDAIRRAGELHGALAAFHERPAGFSIVLQLGFPIEVDETTQWVIGSSKLLVHNGQYVSREGEEDAHNTD